MNLEQFLKICTARTLSETIKNNSFIIFTSKQYPLLFFSLLFKQLKKEKSLSVQRIDLQSSTVMQVISQLETSFLGKITTYWLSNISVLDIKKQKYFLDYCKKYNGPNKIIFFAPETVNVKKIKRSLFFSVSVEVDKKLFIELLIFFINDEKKYESFVLQLFKKCKTIPLDIACLILQYMSILGGSGQHDFLDMWLDTFIAPQQSLFTLSQHFFARQSTSFFVQWAHLADIYSPQFWSVFWSEQLWRAYYYIYFTKQGNIPAARKVGFRLPFSFLRKDWRSLSLEHIKKAHQQMYEIDFSLKNGGDVGIFDLFYSKFFLS